MVDGAVVVIVDGCGGIDDVLGISLALFVVADVAMSLDDVPVFGVSVVVVAVDGATGVGGCRALMAASFCLLISWAALSDVSSFLEFSTI